MAKTPKAISPQVGITGEIDPNIPVLWAPQPGPQTQVMLSDIFEMFLGGAKGGGKANGINNLVSTPFGFKRMGDIKIGDQVSNPCGSVANVIAVHPQGEQDLFRVRFSDGAETMTTDDHLWLARLTARKLKAARRYYDDERRVDAKIYTTKWLKEFMERQAERERDQWGNGPSGVLVPLTEPVEFTRPDWAKWGKTYAFDPYVLGLLLGDGCLRQNQISFSSADEQIVGLLRVGTGLEVVASRTNPQNWRVLSPRTLIEQLSHLGVYGKLAADKFVPALYRTAPVSIRREVLQGLMDTDGYVDSRGHCSFTSVSETLAKDVQWIARSLGFKASVNRGEAGYRNESGDFIQCQDAYDVNIQGQGTRELFKLNRKRERCLDTFNGYEGSRGSSTPCRRIVSIESAGRSEAQCITVDHPNGLYITDDFIVTHNSYGIIGWLTKGNPRVPAEKATQLDLTYLNCPDYRALVLRKNLADLDSWISEAYKVYKALGAAYTQKPNEFTFPSGAKIVMGHLDDDRAVDKYFGNVVHRAAVDELTFIEKLENYMKLKSCVRSNVKGIRAQILLTGNPGGPGTGWVLDRFVEPLDEQGRIIPPNTRIVTKSWNPFLQREVEMDRIFIPSKLKDNPKMMETDPMYYSNLMDLPPALRAAYLEGDWHSLSGPFFDKFRPFRRPVEPPEACHVVPDNTRATLGWLPVFAACDWGFGHNFAVFGAKKDVNGQIVVHKEMVGSGFGSIELGEKIGRMFLPDLEALKRAGKPSIMTLWLSPDAYGKRDEYKTPAEGIASGIGRVIGPEAVHLPDLFDKSAETWKDKLGNFFEQIGFQEKSGITIRRAQNARHAGADHLREMLRWEQIATVEPEKFSPERYALLQLDSEEKARVYLTAFKRREPEVLPKMLIEAHCKELIKAIPALVNDPTDIEDVLKTEALSDDVYDAWRYLLHSENVAMSREPKESYVQKHISRYSGGADVSFDDKVWMSRLAAERYAQDDVDMRPFRIAAASSHRTN